MNTVQTIKSMIIGGIRQVLSKENWIRNFRSAYLFSTFFLLLMLFLFGKLIGFIVRFPIVGRLVRKMNIPSGRTVGHYNDLLSAKLDGLRASEVKRSYLIELAYKNLMVKKTRSFITIFGMSVGIGIIVFLLSLGFGIERLVISRVASLDELKMIDVSSSENTALRLNRTVYEKINQLKKVEKVIPLVSIVGKLTFNKASTDVLVYAAPRSYLDAIKLKPIKGSLYADDTTFGQKKGLSSAGEGDVAGVQTNLEKGVFGARRNSMRFRMYPLPDKQVPVWEDPSTQSRLIGYVLRNEGGYESEQYWGNEYAPFLDYGRGGYDEKGGGFLGKWIRSFMPLYTLRSENELVPQVDDDGKQLWKMGYIQEHYAQIEPIIQTMETSVLGEATESATAGEQEVAPLFDTVVVSSDSSGVEMVMLQSSASASTKKKNDRLVFASKPIGVAVVSTGLTNLLGISDKNAVGTVFRSSFIIGKSLLPAVDGKALSEEIDIKIVGLVDDPNNVYFYVPYAEMQKLTIPHVSQLKVVLQDKESLGRVRKEIETIGFRTNSTLDTVKQIEALFVNLRIVLAVLGLVALGVAALGMFNTLTVSLLERTREIGGMKTMGMVSEEVQDLFMSEAMIMGLSGGIGGLLMGYAVGKGLSILISTLAISSGQGFIDLTYIPTSFVIFILISSFVVGVVTGIYPAERAKRISALNALRYE